MLKDLVSAIKSTYSGPVAKDHVAALSQFHRLQASPGYRAAAEYCLERLRAWGVEAEILSFPADTHTTYWACDMFQEWDATEATLDLVLPGGDSVRLADYREEPIALIQRSLPFDGEAEVVVLDDGGAEEDYTDIDVAGKVVLLQGDVGQAQRLAIRERGAIGLLFDGMREQPPVRQRIDLPDARQYTSFWWRAGEEPRGFGFVLTPRQGDKLRALARQRAKEGRGLLRIRAKVASRLYDGQIEVVSALIRGQTDEEAVVVAHLCHPRPSANDNASGAGAVLEAARTLQTSIDSGRLRTPRRSIRFLWVPEMTGTYAYLATHEDEVERMVAGINLDMVGENQALCESVFVVVRPPEAMAGFGGDLAEALQEALQDEARSLGGTAGYPLYRYAATPFSAGSDHYILSDPTVGVPTVMLNQWPDKFYHTSADTIDKVDPTMLAVAGGLAAAYAYFVAAAGEAEARWLAREITARAKARVGRAAQELYVEAVHLDSPAALGDLAGRAVRRLGYLAGRARASLVALERLAPTLQGVIEDGAGAVCAAADEEWASLEGELERLARGLGAEALPEAQPPSGTWAERAREMVLRRRYRGPVEMPAVLARLGTAERAEVRALLRAERENARTLPTYMLYWIDGRRTLAEVADLVECETGQRNLRFMVQLAEFMVKAGVLEQEH